jgi:hypothetical protein
VLCVPDFIANAGGVICAAMEYQQASQAVAMQTIEDKLRINTTQVLEEAKKTADHATRGGRQSRNRAGQTGHDLPPLVDILRGFLHEPHASIKTVAAHLRGEVGLSRQPASPGIGRFMLRQRGVKRCSAFVSMAGAGRV